MLYVKRRMWINLQSLVPAGFSSSGKLLGLDILAKKFTTKEKIQTFICGHSTIMGYVTKDFATASYTTNHKSGTSLFLACV